MKTINLARIKELLDYSPSTGRFTWKVKRARGKIGALAGCLTPSGYLLLCVDGMRIMGHQLAWLWVHGEIPEKIDHRNGLRSDNRIVNLRPATAKLNAENRRLPEAGASSRFLGVSWAAHAGKWKAQILEDGKKRHLGYFLEELDARDAYLRAKHEAHEGNTLTTPQHIDTLNCAMVKMCMVGTKL